MRRREWTPIVVLNRQKSVKKNWPLAVGDGNRGCRREGRGDKLTEWVV